MKKSLLQLIVCPLCGGELVCREFTRASADAEVESGVLVCAHCRTGYPVIERIPRLLTPQLQNMLWEMHPEFFQRFRDRLPAELLPKEQEIEELLEKSTSPNSDEERNALRAQRETARSFGYEWQAFSEMLPDYEANFRWYFERFLQAGLKAGRVLDAGCGTGRHTFHMSRQPGVGEIIAMDFSQAIEVAARNNRENANAHFLQADIYHPPFPPATFDFVYSLGVLHHLPEPERGFRSLLRLLKPDGYVNIYLYWNLEGEPAWKRAALQLVTQVRRITTRLPHALLKQLSWLIAAIFQVLFVLPARALDHFELTRPLADRVPLGHYRKYSFRVLYTDQFDRFSAPIENRYSRSEVADWLERAGLSEVVILGGAGWRASGRLAAKARVDEEDESAARSFVTATSE